MKNAAFGLIFLCSVVAAQAVPPSDESILKMMNSLQLQTTLDQMVAQLDAGMKAGLKQSMQGKELTPLQTAELGQLQTRMSATIKEELAFAKVKDVYLQVYRETFTQDEVNGINAFYTSPAGKAMIEKDSDGNEKGQGLLTGAHGTAASENEGDAARVFEGASRRRSKRLCHLPKLSLLLRRVLRVIHAGMNGSTIPNDNYSLGRGHIGSPLGNAI